MYKKIISIAIVLGLVFYGGYLTARFLISDDLQASTGPRYSTKAVERGDIKQGVNITGQLSGNWGGSIAAPKPVGITDSNGMSVSVTYKIEEVFVEPNDMIKKGDNLVRLSAVNLGDILNELTEGIQKKQEDIQTKLSNLGKILNALFKGCFFILSIYCFFPTIIPAWGPPKSLSPLKHNMSTPALIEC
jgi:HlyD family secretion protein